MIFKNPIEVGKKFPHSVIAIGNFDGVHIAHQEIIKTAISIGKEKCLKVGVVTFDPHPSIFLKKFENHRLLMTLTSRMNKITALGVDFINICKFDDVFASLTAEDFVRDILIKQMQITHCVTGCNFKFGYKGKGNPDLLNDLKDVLNYQYTKVNHITYEGLYISTTNVKSFLKNLRLNKLKNLLGHNYSFVGKVMLGKQLAATVLDTPTANVRISEDQELPVLGVYLVRINYKSKQFYGIANLGQRPTFEDDSTKNNIILEVHIYNFNQDLYNHLLNVELLMFMRPERKYKDIDQLKYAIDKDKSLGRYILQNVVFA